MKIGQYINLKNSESGINDIAVIDVLGEIGENWWTGEGFTEAQVLNEIKGRSLKEVRLNLSSFGGDYAVALKIKNLVHMTGAKVTAHYFGYNASAVTEIANAASKENTTISADGFVLPHNTSTGVYGNKELMAKAIEDLTTFDNGLANNYAAKSGVKSADEFSALMKQEKWMTADEVVAWGLAGSKTSAQPVDASVITQIRNAVTDKKLITLPSNIKAEDKPDTDMKLEDVAAMFKNMETTIKNLLTPVIKNEMKKTKDGKSVYYDGALEVGTKCYDDEAMTVPCVNGDYEIESNVYTIADGAVTKVEPVAAAEDTATNTEVETLKAELATANSKVTELTNQVKVAKDEVATVTNKLTKEKNDAIEVLNTEFKEFKGKFFTGDKLNPELAAAFDKTEPAADTDPNKAYKDYKAKKAAEAEAKNKK